MHILHDARVVWLKQLMACEPNQPPFRDLPADALSPAAPGPPRSITIEEVEEGARARTTNPPLSSCGGPGRRRYSCLFAGIGQALEPSGRRACCMPRILLFLLLSPDRPPNVYRERRRSRADPPARFYAA